MHERAEDGGHAGADYAEVGFEPRPEADVVVVVGRVGEVVDFSEVLEPNCAADRYEEAYQEGEDDSDFAPRIYYLKLQELRYWEEEYDEVEEDVDSAVDVG